MIQHLHFILKLKLVRAKMKILFLIFVLKFTYGELSEETNLNLIQNVSCKSFEVNLSKDLKTLENNLRKNLTQIRVQLNKLKIEQNSLLQKINETVEEQQIYETNFRELDKILNDTYKTWPCTRPPLITNYDLGLFQKRKFHHEEKTKCYRIKLEKLNDADALNNCLITLLTIEKEIDELDKNVKLSLQHKIDDFLNTNAKWNDHAEKANEAYEKWISKINEINKPLIEEIQKINVKINELKNNEMELVKNYNNTKEELPKIAKSNINKCSGFELKDFINGNLPENSIVGGLLNLEIPLYIIRDADEKFGKYVLNKGNYITDYYEDKFVANVQFQVNI